MRSELIWDIVIGCVVGAGTVLVAQAMARKHGRGVNCCSNCNAPSPFLRRSWSLRQVMWGGYTCSVCSSGFDSSGGDVSPHVKGHPEGTGSL